MKRIHTLLAVQSFVARKVNLSAQLRVIIHEIKRRIE